MAGIDNEMGKLIENILQHPNFRVNTILSPTQSQGQGNQQSLVTADCSDGCTARLSTNRRPSFPSDVVCRLNEGYMKYLDLINVKLPSRPYKCKLR